MATDVKKPESAPAAQPEITLPEVAARLTQRFNDHEKFLKELEIKHALRQKRAVVVRKGC